MPSWPRRTRSTRPAPSLEIQDARNLRAADIRSFCLRAPVEAALLGEHVEALGRYAFYGDQLWCLVDGGRLEGLCWTGGNVVPYRLPRGDRSWWPSGCAPAAAGIPRSWDPWTMCSGCGRTWRRVRRGRGTYAPTSRR